MGKLTENAWIDGVGYGPGFGDRQPPPEVLARLNGDPEPPADPELTVLAGLSADDLAALRVLAEAATELSPAVLAAQLEQLPDDKATLAGFAERHGIEVDNRLGAARMRTAIADAIAAGGEPAGDPAP